MKGVNMKAGIKMGDEGSKDGGGIKIGDKQSKDEGGSKDRR